MSDQNINSRLNYLAELIRTSVLHYESNLPVSSDTDQAVYELITETRYSNPWFIPGHMTFALRRLADEVDYLASKIQKASEAKFHNIGVLFRTEAPLEGIAELILMAASGCRLQVSFQKELKEYFNKIGNLLKPVPSIKDKIIFTGDLSDGTSTFRNSDAIIAFSEINDTLASYLQRFPVLRIYSKGESIIIYGNETEDQLDAIAELVCMYFGRSSKNIRVLFIPEEYNIKCLTGHFERYSDQLFHNKYFNNFEYRKASLLINQIPHEVITPLIITEDINQAGYTGVLCIRRYHGKSDIADCILHQDYPLRVANTGETSNDPLRLSTIRDNIENISRFILQD